jgi:DNA-binding CsgD family transcriptional regulator
MRKTVLVYSGAVAAAAFLLQWMDYQYAVRTFSTEIYIVLIALLFAVLGIWAGMRIAGGGPTQGFEPNAQAIDYLGISEREYEVLTLLAAGHSNREIGAKLFVSPNTVKTHLANLYQKLEVSRRTQAIQKARSLQVIP